MILVFVKKKSFGFSLSIIKKIVFSPCCLILILVVTFVYVQICPYIIHIQRTEINMTHTVQGPIPTWTNISWTKMKTTMQ